MSEKFTPGPWRVNTDYGQIGDVTNEDGTPVAYSQQVLGDTITQSRRKANAHLIAAAPDLYAALERIYGRLLMSDRDGDAHISEEDGAMAEAALRKARGEE